MEMKAQKTPKLVDLTLRDGQQSTLDASSWVLEPHNLAKVIADLRKAGFHGAEVAGGQSFQIAITQGYNPFTITGALSHALEQSGDASEFSLQMLFRGANALGFRHYDKDLIEITLKEFIKQGISKIRFFDALNDIENLQLPESIRETSGITLEGAVCFTHYTEFPERYADDYYVRYTQALLDAGYNAIAIKDMSGQLTELRIATLIPALLEILTPLNIPLSLHLHSTNDVASKAALAKALEYDIHAIETVQGCLSGGSAHHSLETVAPQLIENPEAYDQLTNRISKLWGKTPERRDQQIPQELKDQLCAAGVPGGAMPFVIRDLHQQVSAIRAKYLASDADKSVLADEGDFSAIVDLFLAELKRVCRDAGLPILVTPTADICCKQAIANLAMGANPQSDSLADRYLNKSGQPNPDPRFAKLILGYYGELKAYDDAKTVHGPEPKVVQFFEAQNALQLKKAESHPSLHPGGDDLVEAQESAWKLIQQKGAKALSFASFDQLTILYALKPAAGPSVDPIANAVEQYLKHTDTAKIDGRGSIFPEYAILMKPILSYLGAMSALKTTSGDSHALNTKIADLGSRLSNRLFDIYIDLTIWKNVTDLTNHLSKLLTSSNISAELTTAVRHVSDSLTNLDLRPINSDKSTMEQAIERFSELSVSELFGSLALINSFVNDVAKHATNPRTYSERPLHIDDLSKFATSTETPDSLWEASLKRSIVTKYGIMKTDFQNRSELWIG